MMILEGLNTYTCTFVQCTHILRHTDVTLMQIYGHAHIGTHEHTYTHRNTYAHTSSQFCKPGYRIDFFPEIISQGYVLSGINQLNKDILATFLITVSNTV